MVRAKFLVMEKNEEDKKVVLIPVVDDNEENKAFFEATPSGEIQMSILNQPALDEFEVGSQYYVDFTKAEPAIAQQPPVSDTETAAGGDQQSTDDQKTVD